MVVVVIMCVLGAIALIEFRRKGESTKSNMNEFVELMSKADVLPKITPRGGIHIDPKDVVASKGYRKYVHKPKENSNETM